MKSVTKAILLSFAMVAFIAISIAIYINYYSVPHFDFAPIQRNATSLTQPDVEAILRKHFKTLRRSRQIPPTVKQSFTNVLGPPFDMGGRGGLVSDIFDTSGSPPQRLNFAAVADNAAILVFKVNDGGPPTFDIVIVMIFCFGDHPGAWGAVLKSDAKNLDGVRTLIRRQQLDVMNLRRY